MPIDVTLDAALDVMERLIGRSAEKMRAFSDEYAREQGGTIQCRRGCHNCCHSKVAISISEGLLIYRYLVRSGMWCATLQEHLVTSEKRDRSLTHAEFMRGKNRCAFLFDDNECSVYEARPIGCVSTFSYRGPVGCDAAGESVSFGVIGKDVMSWRSLARISIDVDEALGLKGIVFTIPGAVLVAHAYVEKLPLPDVAGCSIFEMRRAAAESAEGFDLLTIRTDRGKVRSPA